MSQRITDRDRRAMLARYAGGESSPALAAAYGIAASTVRFHAAAAGITAGADVAVPAAGDLSWMRRGRCAETDPEAFYPEKGGSPADARAVCLGCEVRATCLAYALEHDERWGVWGGSTERERRRMKRQQEQDRTSEERQAG